VRYDSDQVRLLYTFRGEKTLFTNHTTGDIEAIPDNHLVVFTAGAAFGANHTRPLRSSTQRATPDGEALYYFERFTIVITGQYEKLTSLSDHH